MISADSVDRRDNENGKGNGMKVRKLAVALALAGGLSSGLAHALGMGEGRILTRLNEPLRAEIELTQPGDVTTDQIKVELAPDEAFERFGIRRMGILHQLDFEITRDGDNTLIVEVTTDKPIREPFLKMLVELTWPNGRLMREYSFLVDPPKRTQGPEALGPQADSGAGQSQASGPEPEFGQRRSAAMSGQASAEPRQPGEYGPTSANDTLWSIAGRVNTASDVTRQQVMLALQDANPDAFVNNNINRLRQGQVLRFPSEQEIRSRSTREAVREVMAQNEAFRSRRGDSASDAVVEGPGSDADGRGSGSGAADGAGSGDDELRILVADNESGNGEGDIAGMGDGEGDEALSAALEELDRAERDREELKSRLSDLEEQIDTMAQLIELKDNQLAELQQRLAEANEDAEIPEDPQVSEQTGEDVAAADETAAQEEDEEDSDRADGVAAAGDDTPDPESGEAPEPAPEDEGAGSGDGDGAPETTGDMAESGEDGGGDGQEQTGAATGTTSDSGDSGQQTGMPEAPTSVGGFFDRLVREPMYQIGAGLSGIVLLLLLWALARRNAAREKAFYDQIRDISGDEETQDVLDLESEGETPVSGEDSGEESGEAGSEAAASSDDAIAEADVYMAYGRMEQAAQHLEEAISQEPSRTDLRLKLLEVYAGSGDSDTFEKQYRELSALGDDNAVAKADALREQLVDAGEDLSIDDLAEQLKTGPSSDSETAEPEAGEDDSFDFSALDEADELLSEDESVDTTSPAGSDEAMEFEEDFGFGDEEIPQGEEAPEGAGDDDSIDFEFSGTGDTGESSSAEAEPETSSQDEDVEDLGFSLDDLELEEPEPEAEAPAEEPASDESGLDLDLEDESAIPEANEFADVSDEEVPLAGGDTSEAEAGEPLAEEEPEPLTEISESVEEEPTPAPESGEEDESESAPFDDSFLEELDAELDKVTDEESGGEEPETAAPEEPQAQETETGEMAEETAQSESSGEELSDLELDVSEDDLALMDEFAGEESGEAAEQPADTSDQEGDELLDTDLEDTSAEETLSDEEKAALEGEELPASEPASEAGQEKGSEDEDDEFDFLEGTDEAGTKLDLARAYVEMGDAEGARDILEEVAKEGSEEQQQEAQRLLGEL